MSNYNKSCNCLETIEKNIEKEYGDFVFTNMGSYIDVSSKVGDAKVMLRPQGLHFKTRAKNKDGSFSNTKWIKRHVGFTHCPFCGVEYE